MQRLLPVLALLLTSSFLQAQAEVGLIINALLQGLQAAEAIRQSVDRANQFPTPPNQPLADPIWNYDEASLVPSHVLRNGPLVENFASPIAATVTGSTSTKKASKPPKAPSAQASRKGIGSSTLPTDLSRPKPL